MAGRGRGRSAQLKAAFDDFGGAGRIGEDKLEA